MSPRVVGIAHAVGVNAFFGLDINEFYSFLVKDGTENRTVAQINAEIVEMKQLHETRSFAVFAEGSADFITAYRDGVQADWLIACASEHTLASLGITALDAGWTARDGALDLATLLRQDRA